MASNVDTAKSFYHQLLGWEANAFNPTGDPSAPPYFILKNGPNDPMGTAGLLQCPDPAMPSVWIPYVVVQDLDVSLAKAAELGARVLVPAMAIGNIGRIAVLLDPVGATVGLHEFPK